MPRIAFTLLTLIFSVTIQAQLAIPYSNLIVFGDELSDGGNNTSVIGSNNNENINSKNDKELAVEILAKQIGLSVSSSNHLATEAKSFGFNYAISGSKITKSGSGLDLPNQINAYLDTHKNGDSNALYIIGTGSNDMQAIRDAWIANDINSNEVGLLIRETISTMSQQVNKLVDAGARNIVIFNIPNTGIEIDNQMNLASNKLNNSTKIKIKILNKLLASEIARIQEQHVDLNANIQTFDINGLLNLIKANAIELGVSNTEDNLSQPIQELIAADLSMQLNF
jgi:phospholipase/lecithinase/hemolysin